MISGRPNKPLFGVATLMVFFLFLSVNQDLHGQSTYGVPICTFYSSANSPQGGFSSVYVKQVTVAGINKTTGGGTGASRNYTSTTLLDN